MVIDNRVHLADNQDNLSAGISNKNADSIKKNSIIKDSININKDHLYDLDPNIRNSIEDFIKNLNGHLNDIPLTKEQKRSIEKQIEEIAKEIKEIPSYKEIQHDLSKDSARLSNESNNDPIACHDRSAEIKPLTDNEHYNKGLSLYYQGSFNEAIACYDRAIEINPENADAHYNKGIILAYIGNNSEAIACYDRAIEINPQNAHVYYNKGLSLAAMEKFSEAIACFDRAIGINPQNADAHYNKGLSLASIGDNIEAIACFDKALEIQSDNVSALNKKAWYLANYFPERLNEASETIKKAMGLDPTNSNVIHTYGYTLDKLKTYKEAVVVYEHILKQTPSFPNVWYDCARSKIKLDVKNIQSCINDLQKAIELNPTYKEKAKYEIDFENIKNNPDFKRIIEV